MTDHVRPMSFQVRTALAPLLTMNNPGPLLEAGLAADAAEYVVHASDGCEHCENTGTVHLVREGDGWHSPNETEMHPGLGDEMDETRDCGSLTDHESCHGCHDLLDAESIEARATGKRTYYLHDTPECLIAALRSIEIDEGGAIEALLIRALSTARAGVQS